MTNTIPVFKEWVPEWLVRLALLMVVLPGVVLFALSVSNVNAAAGYYGISPNDVQYSLIILYGSMASFLVLEGRFFKNIASKEYLLIGVAILMATCYWCYVTRSFLVLLALRYIQGLLTCGTISITLTLMFNRLHSERSKEIGYSVVYCILLIIIPLTTVLTASIIDNFNFNVIYKCAVYSYLPGAIVMFFAMNNVRLNRKFPLAQLDWASFVIYSLGLGLIGYVLVYGQQYEWLDDTRILTSIVAIILLFAIFITRQLTAKRPYLHLAVFKNPKFTLGAVLLFVFYICRGSFGITTAYLGSVLGMDPIHIGYLLIYNIAGIILSVFIASRLLLLKRSIRLIFISGFALLLIFHVYMCFIFSTQVDASALIIPLILQGLGAGMLMVPVILFIVSSSPPNYGSTGSAIGIFTRFLGFCGSIALINFFQLRGQNSHYNRFQDQLSSLNPDAIQRLANYKQALTGRGLAPDQAAKIANGLLSKSIAVQAQLRFSVDYYHMISWLLVAIILLIALFPSVNKTVISVHANQPAPVAY
jgi:DHA2 family multidrug resistance protein